MCIRDSVVADASQNEPVDPLGDIGTIDLAVSYTHLDVYKRQLQ